MENVKKNSSSTPNWPRFSHDLFTHIYIYMYIYMMHLIIADATLDKIQMHHFYLYIRIVNIIF